jgi:hypothetical protein
MACSPSLRAAVANILTANPNFQPRHSYDLNVHLRYHLNDALAAQQYSTYAPSVGRAERLDRRNQYAIQMIESMADNVVKELRAKLAFSPLGVPSVTAALLERSKGEPRALIAAAMEFRARSEPLRNTLHDLASAYPSATPESLFDLHLEISELGRQLRRDAKLEESTGLPDAVDVKFVVGVPVPSLSGEKTKKWIIQRFEKERVAVLTELVRASAFSNLSARIYRKLRANSSARAN